MPEPAPQDTEPEGAHFPAGSRDPSLTPFDGDPGSPTASQLDAWLGNGDGEEGGGGGGREGGGGGGRRGGRRRRRRGGGGGGGGRRGSVEPSLQNLPGWVPANDNQLLPQQHPHIDLDDPNLYQMDQDQDDHNPFNGPSDGNNASADTIYSRASNMANSESQVLDHSGIQFLLAVSSQAEYCLPYQLASSSGLTQPQTPQRLLDNLTNGGIVSSPVLTIPQPHTTQIQSMADQAFICSKIDEANVMVHLAYFINCMKFACMTNR